MFLTHDDQERADWPLIKDGAVTLFWRVALLDETCAALKALGYRVIDLDCASEKAFRRDVSDALRWKEQFGYEPWDGNLNALDDALYSSPLRPAQDVALSLRGFDRLLADGAALPEGFLDVMERQSRRHLLEGSRLLVLVQVSDASLHFDGLGALRANWNAREWLNANRGLS